MLRLAAAAAGRARVIRRSHELAKAYYTRVLGVAMTARAVEPVAETVFPLARVKKMMKLLDEVKQVSPSASFAMSRAVVRARAMPP